MSIQTYPENGTFDVNRSENVSFDPNQNHKTSFWGAKTAFLLEFTIDNRFSFFASK